MKEWCNVHVKSIYLDDFADAKYYLVYMKDAWAPNCDNNVVASLSSIQI